jgi:peroxiredoxin
MKFLIYCMLFTCITCCCVAQDPVDILKKSRAYCKSVQGGNYESVLEKKYMSRKDTTVTTMITEFSRTDSDTLLGIHYNGTVLQNKYQTVSIYTGNELIRLFPDSSAEITNRILYPDQIRLMKSIFGLNNPLTHRNQYPIPADSNLTKPDYIVKYVGKTMLEEQLCHHIEITLPNENEPGDPMQCLSHVVQLWVSESSYLPLQHSITMVMVMNNDTMVQYERLKLVKHDFIKQPDPAKFTTKTIPEHYKVKEFAPFAAPELLELNSQAPDWTFSTTEGETIRLSELKGKVVLLDFYYKGCFPCMLAIPELQKLHEQFKDSGLMVIGMNPIDSAEEIAEFKKKRSVTYPSIIATKELAEEYNVSGYPTFYLIDKAGKIIFRQSGYESGKENIPVSLIKENL